MAHDWIAHIALRLTDGEEVVIKEAIHMGDQRGTPTRVSDGEGDPALAREAMDRAGMAAQRIAHNGSIRNLDDTETMVAASLGVVAMVRLDYDIEDQP